MKEYKFLKFLDKTRSIFEMSGINYPIMRKILEMKFLMDERKVPTIITNEKKGSDSKNSMKSALFIYTFIGLFIGIFLFLELPLFLKMNIIIGMIMFMIMTTMISDFSSILLDIDDKNILLPRPVDSKTLNTAKILHIIVYLLRIMITISAGSLIIGFIRYGIIFSFIFLCEMILICGFVILFTSLFYYVILTAFSGEKLKDIINFFQIILTIFMTIMYQLIGRIFDISNFNIKIIPHWWDFILPSAWFSSPFMLLIENDFNAHYGMLSIVGVIVPIITIFLYVKVVSPGFEKKLQKLNHASYSNDKELKKGGIQTLITNVFCYHPLEKVFFRFTLQMLKNERKLKLKIYPNIAFSVIMPFIFFFNFLREEQSFSQALAQVSNGNYFLYLYFSVAFFATLFPMISASENYKGSWVYYALPINNPVVIIKAAFKAFLYQYILPVYLFISLIFIIIFNFKVIPNLILIFLNMLIIMLLTFCNSKKELPFYKDFHFAKNGNNTAMVLLMFGLCGVVSAIHYIFLVFVPFGIMIHIGISLIIFIIIWKYSFKFTWEDVEII